jgi:hypothetical protein
MEAEEADGMIEALAALHLPTPGLKWKRRSGGRRVPYWYADETLVKTGYPLSSANLSGFTQSPQILAQRCQRLHAEMLQWKTGLVRPGLSFDGTYRTVIELYISDPESPFNTKLKAGSRKSYMVYARKLQAHIGALRIDDSDGRDIKRWFSIWAEQEEPGKARSPYRKLGAGRMALAVLQAALSFGIACRRAGCAELQAIIIEMARVYTFPSIKPRLHAPTAAQIEAARTAAHAAGAPLRALCYALQFETQARQFDLTGQWVDLSDPRPSAIHDKGQKWIGPTWGNIDDNLIFRMTPTKTEDTTAARGVFDLKVCPMVMEEIARIPAAKRVGPLIVIPATGLPYRYEGFRSAWHADFKAAGIPKGVWNRDLRAGGNTEASISGVGKEDRAKISGHSERINAEVYDRDRVEAHRRSMQLRTAQRKNATKT